MMQVQYLPWVFFPLWLTCMNWSYWKVTTSLTRSTWLAVHIMKSCHNSTTQRYHYSRPILLPTASHNLKHILNAIQRGGKPKKYKKRMWRWESKGRRRRGILDVLCPVNRKGSYQGETKCIPITSTNYDSLFKTHSTVEVEERKGGGQTEQILHKTGLRDWLGVKNQRSNLQL